MPTEDGVKPLEVKHSRGMQILGVRPSKYWGLMRDGLIKAVGSGKDSRAVYASLEAYHRSRLEAPKKTLKMTLAMIDRRKARIAASAAEKPTEKLPQNESRPPLADGRPRNAG